MDTVTQAVLGAAVGQAGFRKLGRRASAFGVFCGLFPDFDIVLGGGDPWRGLVTHRGSSHSLLVLPLLAVPIGWLGWRVLGRRGSPKTWIHLAFWGLITHPLLDAFTTYGTQLLAPISRARFAWDGVAILDPIYTVPLLISAVLGLREATDDARATRWARGALAWGLAYLLLGVATTGWAKATFASQLAGVGFEPVRLRCPVPVFNPFLRHGVAEDAQGRVAVGTVLPWDADATTPLVLDSADGPRVQAALSSERGDLLQWFADGYVTVVEEDDGTLVFRDHRYGLLSQPAYTFFKSRLPADAEPQDLRRGHRPAERDLDMVGEFTYAWGLVLGRR